MRPLVLAALVAGCSPDPIDPSLALPDRADGLRVGVVQEPGGEATAVVVGRLLVRTDDEARLQDLLARTGGRVVRTTGTGVRVVEVPAPEGAVSGLVASDPDTLGTVALALAEDAPGFEVDVDLVLSPSSHVDRTLHESALPDASIPLSPWNDNPFGWPHLASGTVQDTGIAEAWRRIEQMGLDTPSVRVAIVDGGFSSQADLPAPVAVVSADPTVPAASVLGTANPALCGGLACPWHGTQVASALGAIHGNALGTAGAAGQVVEPVYVYFDGTSSQLDDAIDLAVAQGAEVLLLTHEGKVLGTTLTRPARRVQSAVNRAHAADVVVVAAAGNSGKDVDAVDAYGAEKAWWFPCEFDHVLCVGALRYDSDRRDPISNRGASVDLYLPGTVFVGPDPTDAGDVVKTFVGTSAAAALAAGEVAMTRAAGSDLSGDDVVGVVLGAGHLGGAGLIADADDAIEDAAQGVFVSGYVTPASPFQFPISVDSDDEVVISTFTDTTTPGIGGAAWSLNLYGPTGIAVLQSPAWVTCCDWEGGRIYRDLGRLTPELTTSTVEYTSAAGEYNLEAYVDIRSRDGANEAGLTVATAPLLPLPSDVSGNVRGDEPGHHWSVALNPGQQATLTLDLVGSNVYYVDVFDETGAQVMSSPAWISPGRFQHTLTNTTGAAHTYTWRLRGHYVTELEYEGTFTP